MMPLQIFEKHPTADAYRVGGFYSPYALVGTDKRFTEAELAAEYWRANAVGWMHEDSGLTDASDKDAAEALTWYRFFQLPHFDGAAE